MTSRLDRTGQARLTRAGIAPLAAGRGVALCDRALASGRAVVVAASLDWQALRALAAEIRRCPRCSRAWSVLPAVAVSPAARWPPGWPGWRKMNGSGSWWDAVRVRWRPCSGTPRLRRSTWGARSGTWDLTPSPRWNCVTGSTPRRGSGCR